MPKKKTTFKGCISCFWKKFGKSPFGASKELPAASCPECHSKEDRIMYEAV